MVQSDDEERDLDWTDEKQLLRSSQRLAEDDELVLEDEVSAKKRAKSPAHVLGPICPICSKTLGMGTSNQDLNEHIDWCLNRDAVRKATVTADDRPVKRAKPGEEKDYKSSYNEGGSEKGKGKKGKMKEPAKGSMMEWLSRAG